MTATRHPLLFDRFPSLGDRLPWLPLAEGLPTRIESLQGLADAAAVRAALWVKRDDQTSALYGGNKVRKLAWLLAAARAKARPAAITVGAWGSNHALATALFARACGLDAHLVLYPQPLTPHVVQNLTAALGSAARVRCTRTIPLAPLAYAREALIARHQSGRWPARIPAGGSSPRGTLGYVECGLEIARQVAAGEVPTPDRVYAAAGTCGTVAGLALGLALGAREVPALARTIVCAVRVVPAFIANAPQIERLASKAARLLASSGAGRDALASPVQVEMVTDQLGPGYGHATEQGARAIELARAQGLGLEPTYTGKALAAMLADAARMPDATMLYVHTLSSADLSPHVTAALSHGLTPLGFDPRPV